MHAARMRVAAGIRDGLVNELFDGDSEPRISLSRQSESVKKSYEFATRPCRRTGRHSRCRPVIDQGHSRPIYLALWIIIIGDSLLTVFAAWQAIPLVVITIVMLALTRTRSARTWYDRP